MRELSRGRRKNDVIDAAAAASVAALHGDANPVVGEDITTVLALLDERRSNVSAQPTRLVNQVHAVFLGSVAWWGSTSADREEVSDLLCKQWLPI